MSDLQTNDPVQTAIPERAAKPVVQGEKLRGADKVARMFAGLGSRFAGAGLQVEQHEVNGQPGAVLRDASGRVINVVALDVLDGRIQVVRSVINPDKLHHIGPVADAWALMRQVRPAGG